MKISMKKELFIFCFLCLFSLLFFQCKVKSEVEVSSTEDTATEDYYWVAADINPSFPGGDKELYCFIDNNIDKELLGKIDTTGRSFVQFTVDTLGEIKDVEILKSLTKELDTEIIRLVDLMPYWEPSLVQGKLVERQMILPLKIPYESKCDK